MKRELRILLLEDMTLDAELIAHELQRGGLPCRTRQVQTKSLFLHELQHHPPDVILSDHGLPAFDGLTALATARDYCPGVPFIFVTGARGEEAAVETLKQGADDYVLKSRLHRLVPAIRHALHRAEERLPQPQAEAALRELEEFTDTLARELRAPLRHVDSFVELLQKTAAEQLDPKGRSALATVREAARRISELTDELFTFCRIGRRELLQLHFSLADLLKEALEDLRRDTENRRIDWVIGELPEMYGDPTLIGHALTELLANALKFTRPRAQARIQIACQTTDREFIISVADNGVGFDPRDTPRLFGIFQRLHPPGEFAGLGVGLANVRRVVQRHGGRAWAQGTPDQGATFYISLPRPSRAARAAWARPEPE